MKDPLQYCGCISPYGTAIKQYSYKNLSVCVSEDEKAFELNGKHIASPGKVLHISFDSNASTKNKETDMLYCVRRLGLDTALPYREFDIQKANPMKQHEFIHYYEQVK